MKDQKTEPRQLYDLQKDPGQMHNLFDQYPEKADDLKHELERVQKPK